MAWACPHAMPSSPVLSRSVQPTPTFESSPRSLPPRSTLLVSPLDIAAQYNLPNRMAFKSRGRRAADSDHRVGVFDAWDGSCAQHCRAPPPTASSNAGNMDSPRQKADTASLEMVWDGPRPRLRAPLRIPATGAEPDFACATSRAYSTARRLGLKLPALDAPTGAPRAPSRAEQPSAAKKCKRAGRPTGHAARRSPGGASESDWLATEQLDFLSVLSEKASAGA